VSGTGALTTPTGGGSLFLTAGSNGITVSAPIKDNGGAVTLVKSGSGTLTLSSTTSTYSGGTVVNAGGLTFTSDSNFGAASGAVTVNGSCNFNVPNFNSYVITPPGTTFFSGRTLTLNNGAVVTVNSGLTDYQFAIAGPVVGTGGFTMNGNQWNAIFLTSTANTFTGPVTINGGNQVGIFSVASIGDGSHIKFLYGNSTNPTYNKGGFYFQGGNAPMVLNNRYILLANTAANGADAVYNNNASAANTLTINTDLLVNTPLAAQTLRLDGTNTGDNTFAGRISDGPGTVVSLEKGGGTAASTGTWILSGTNTYTGTTTVSGGKLILSNAWSVASGKLDVKSGAKVQLDYTGSRPVAEFYTNNFKAASGIYNNANAPAYILGAGSIMVGIETFTVTYTGNGNTGGAAPVDPNAYTNNATVTVLGGGTLTKDNWSFGGWSIQDGPTYAPGSTFQITTNTTMSAIWRPAGTFIQFM